MVGWNNYRGGMSEDCLVVNVWTPALKDGGNRTVMVCFHGGGFTSGSGNLVALEGDHLVRTGNVVVVNVNHRLGALGYLDLSAFGGPELATSGVAGMMDCVAALRWVRDNIENFGGNPASVLVFGQSGGGGKCSTLMAMPSAKGLFHRVALQSGSTLRIARHETAQKNAEALLTKLEVAKGDLAKLQSLPFEQIIAAQTNAGPVMDGVVVPRDPFDPDAPAISADVPMLVGTCLEDAGLNMTDWDADEAALQIWVEAQVPGKSAEVIAAYRKLYPGKRPYLIKAMIATDRSGRRNSVTQAERKVAQGTAPVYHVSLGLARAGRRQQMGRHARCGSQRVVRQSHHRHDAQYARGQDHGPPARLCFYRLRQERQSRQPRDSAVARLQHEPAAGHDLRHRDPGRERSEPRIAADVGQAAVLNAGPHGWDRTNSP